MPDTYFNLQKGMKNIGNSKCVGKHERLFLIALDTMYKVCLYTYFYIHLTYTVLKV